MMNHYYFQNSKTLICLIIYGLFLQLVPLNAYTEILRGDNRSDDCAQESSDLPTSSEFALPFANLTVDDDGGGDFTTITAALAAITDDASTITVTGGADNIHTEQGIIVTKNVIIKGQGVGTTIVQAAATPNTATDRVFQLSDDDQVNVITLQDMTIRHGKTTNQGGGIRVYIEAVGSQIKLKNLKVLSNYATVFGSALHVKGENDLSSPGSIEIENCSFDQNIGINNAVHLQEKMIANFTNCSFINNAVAVIQTSNGTETDRIALTLKNCTIHNNISPANRQTISLNGANVYLYNCSITQNIGGTTGGSRTFSGGISFSESNSNVGLWLYNNIIYGNKTNTGELSDIKFPTDVSTFSLNANINNLVGACASNSGSFNCPNFSFSEDPKFTSLDSCGCVKFFHLNFGSVALQASSNQAPDPDICGKSRATNPDLGPFDNLILVEQPLGLTTDETGGTATFQVKLNRAPSDNVTIGLSSSDTGEGIVSPANLIFSSSNWNTPQTVTITGVDDALPDVGETYSIITAPATSNDALFNGINPLDVSLANLDDDATQRAIIFDGDNDYLLLPEDIGNTLSNEFTIQFWVKRDNADDRDYIITQEGNATNNGKLVIGFNAGTTFTFDFWDNRINYDYGTEDNQWHHWACVFNTNLNGQTNRWLYRDGLLVGSNDGGDYTGSGKLWLGGDNAFSSYFFGGRLDDIRFYNKARSQGEIQGDMNTELTGAETNLIAYIPVNKEDCFPDYSTNHYPIGVIGFTNNTPLLGVDYPTLTEVAPTTFPNNETCIGLTINPASIEVNEGNTVNVAIALNVAPTANVTVNLNSSNTAEVTISPEILTFTPQNWNSTQTVTVTGVETTTVAPDFVYEILTAALVSTDPAYNGIAPPNIQVRKLENDCVVSAAIQDRTTARQDYIDNFLASNWSYGDLGWTGNTGSCTPGIYNRTIQEKLLQRLNYYRRLAGATAMLTNSPGKELWAQHASLVMQANSILSHSLTGNEACFTAEAGAGAAGNLAQHNQVANPVDQWMDDAFENGLGHRRWGLYSKARSVGHGMAPNYACQWIREDDTPAFTNYIAYPPGGYIPNTIAYTDWGFMIHNASFSTSDVKIYGPNGPVSVEVLSRGGGTGDNGITFRPVIRGINRTSTTDISYQVIISGVVEGDVTKNYCYTVTLFDPNEVDGGVDCPDTEEVSGTVGNGTVAALKTITTSGTTIIPSGGDVTFQAPQSITLNDGFHAVAGSSFKAVIGDVSGINSFANNCNASLTPSTPNTSRTAYETAPLEVAPLPVQELSLKVAPNPFHYSTTIQYELPNSGPVSMALVNLQGTMVKELLSGAVQDAGLHQIAVQSDNMDGGIYFVIIRTAEGIKTKKMMLIR